jgi:pimeloyl-ACP methyl ester carboxylesterase
MNSISLPTRPAARSWQQRLLRMILTLVALYGAVLLLLYWKQELLLFMPTRLSATHEFTVPGVVERKVEVDGATLSALHFRQPNAKGLVFFLHGNGGSLQEWVTGTDFYRRTGFDLFMLDYRGYGKSTGRIASEAQLHADVRAALQAIVSEYAGRKLVLYGRSLGTGLATKLATEVNADLLVLVSPYSSLRDVAREHYPWVPPALLRYPMRTDEWLPKVAMPVMILHGDRDDVIGFAHGQRLHALKPTAEFVRLRDVGHNDVHLSREYVERLAERLGRL